MKGVHLWLAIVGAAIVGALATGVIIGCLLSIFFQIQDINQRLSGVISVRCE